MAELAASLEGRASTWQELASGLFAGGVYGPAHVAKRMRLACARRRRARAVYSSLCVRAPVETESQQLWHGSCVVVAAKLCARSCSALKNAHSNVFKRRT